MVEKLIDAGADFSIPVNGFKNVLDWAIHHNYHSIERKIAAKTYEQLMSLKQSISQSTATLFSLQQTTQQHTNIEHNQFKI